MGVVAERAARAYAQTLEATTADESRALRRQLSCDRFATQMPLNGPKSPTRALQPSGRNPAPRAESQPKMPQSATCSAPLATETALASQTVRHRAAARDPSPVRARGRPSNEGGRHDDDNTSMR
jgi:hypothetical protein